MYFMLFFAGFISLVSLLAFIFFYSKHSFFVNLMSEIEIFRRLKKEMILSNQLLYIIDFEALTQNEKDNITKFLTSF